MKKYVYRKHLREPIKFLVGITLFIIMFLPYFGLVMILGGDSDKVSDIFEHIGVIIGGITAFLVIVGLEFTIFYFAMFRKFKKIYISIGEEGVIYNNSKGCEIIPYEDIQKLTFPSIKYTGGWVRIKYKGGDIRLTVVLEGIGEFLNELKTVLDEKGMSYIYNEKKLYSFYKTATFSDQGWDRAYEKFSKYLVVQGISILIGLFSTILIKDMGNKFIVAFVMLIYPLVSFSLAEMVLGRKLVKLSKLEGYDIQTRDKALEDKIYKNTFIVLGIIVAFIVLAMIIL